MSELREIQVHITNTLSGLQTPRLKRLAEIVSAQAIAQQEKLDYPSQQDEYLDEGEEELGDVDEIGA